MGKPDAAIPHCPSHKALGRAPREVKHFSTWRKIEKHFIPLVAASEKGTAQTRVLRTQVIKLKVLKAYKAVFNLTL